MMFKKTIFFILMLFISTKTYSAQKFIKPPKESKGVYVIGWSKNGHFAFGTFTDECGNYGICNESKVIIQNMKSDKKVMTLSSGYNEGVTADEPDTFLKYWVKENKKISKTLNKYAIQPLLSKDSIVKDITLLKQLYGITFEVKTKKINDDSGAPYYSLFSIHAKNNKGKSKRIYSENADFNYNNKPKIIGFVKSPHEERIALLVRFSWGGSDSGSVLKFIGCQLNKGYK